MLIELYNKLKAKKDHEDFELVFCSMDRTLDEYNSYCSKMPWWCLPHKSPVMGRLSNLYGARGIPHLVVLDKDGTLMGADGVGLVSMDPEGHDFPWRPKPIVDLLPSYYLSSSSTSSDDQTMTLLPMTDLDEKHLMLYFSAHWCPPCRRFTPHLSKAYQALKKQRPDDFELLFVSSDHNQQAFDEYFGEMTFGALPYDERKAKADLSSRLGVRGIPTLIMLGPKPANGDRPVINSNVRPIIESGDYLSEFPYKPKPYGSLNKTTDDINNFKCLIVFHEGGDDDEQDDIQEVLQMVANKNTAGSDSMRFYWANSPDGLSKTVRDALKLGPTTDEPLMVLLDIPDGGSFYVSAIKDITVESVEAFMASPGAKLSV